MSVDTWMIFEVVEDATIHHEMFLCGDGEDVRRYVEQMRRKRPHLKSRIVRPTLINSTSADELKKLIDEDDELVRKSKEIDERKVELRTKLRKHGAMQ